MPLFEQPALNANSNINREGVPVPRVSKNTVINRNANPRCGNEMRKIEIRPYAVVITMQGTPTTYETSTQGSKARQGKVRKAGIMLRNLPPQRSQPAFSIRHHCHHHCLAETISSRQLVEVGGIIKRCAVVLEPPLKECRWWLQQPRSVGTCMASSSTTQRQCDSRGNHNKLTLSKGSPRANDNNYQWKFSGRCTYCLLWWHPGYRNTSLH